ncbi:hypothetical protein MMC10_008732 [Thelotrema lepadinum]|nr:hypothetical protein [Thelotrema lepadinum]
MQLARRSHAVLAVGIPMIFISLIFFFFRSDSVTSSSLWPSPGNPVNPEDLTNPENPEKKEDEPDPPHPPWTFKPEPDKAPPIVDNFLVASTSPKDIPSVPVYNTPPSPHVREKTPLLIGFTRNWRLLQQVVVSYITAGWPPSDIFVIENTGVMRSNEQGRLSLQNPFYLDYKRLKDVLGVNIIRTPTLLNFAQLQNFYLSTALDHEWPAYFWSHMDVVAVSNEAHDDYKSLYLRAVDAYRESFSGEYLRTHKWAARWFSYDRFTLVNTKTYAEVGGWDTFIGYYITDCDMHERLYMAGYETPDARAGGIWDVATTLDDLSLLYRRNGSGEAVRNDDSYRALVAELDRMQEFKGTNEKGRNTWQGRQQGGQDEPFYRDHTGFEEAIRIVTDQGKALYAEKWGHRGCDLRGSGLNATHAWKVEKDF